MPFWSHWFDSKIKPELPLQLHRQMLFFRGHSRCYLQGGKISSSAFFNSTEHFGLTYPSIFFADRRAGRLCGTIRLLIPSVWFNLILLKSYVTESTDLEKNQESEETKVD